MFLSNDIQKPSISRKIKTAEKKLENLKKIHDIPSMEIFVNNAINKVIKDYFYQLNIKVDTTDTDRFEVSLYGSSIVVNVIFKTARPSPQDYIYITLDSDGNVINFIESFTTKIYQCINSPYRTDYKTKNNIYNLMSIHSPNKDDLIIINKIDIELANYNKFFMQIELSNGDIDKYQMSLNKSNFDKVNKFIKDNNTDKLIQFVTTQARLGRY